MNQRKATFLGSSVAERSAVNRLVVGSNPTRGVFFVNLSLLLIGEADWSATELSLD
jgi:hypothetical protein